MSDERQFPETWWEGPGARLLLELEGEAPTDALEERVLARCQAPLRRRRVLRRVRGASLAAALFLGGLWLGRSGLPAETVPDSGRGMQAQGAPDVETDPVVPQAPSPGPSLDSQPRVPTDPQRVEMLAEVRPEETSAEDLRQAGDRFLTERLDVNGALRCYRKYLERLPAAERACRADGDTWLLASLRRAL